MNDTALADPNKSSERTRCYRRETSPIHFEEKIDGVIVRSDTVAIWIDGDRVIFANGSWVDVITFEICTASATGTNGFIELIPTCSPAEQRPEFLSPFRM